MNANDETYINFMHEIEAERDWRVAELNKMKLLFREINEMDISEFKNIYLKMTVPMIYAHWEGFCVASFKILMDYVNRKEIDANRVAYNVLTYANSKTYDKLKGKNSLVLVRKWGDCLKQAKSTVTHYPSPHRLYAVCLWCLLVKACCITALPYLQYAYKQS